MSSEQTIQGEDDKDKAIKLYLEKLIKLKPGNKGLLRLQAGQEIDSSVDAFDLFSGLWWSIRQKYSNTPARRICWLIAKLYGSYPLPHEKGKTIAHQLIRVGKGMDDKKMPKFEQRFDQLLIQPVSQIEPNLCWALGRINSQLPDPTLDWIQLTKDLNRWGKGKIRYQWAENFLNIN